MKIQAMARFKILFLLLFVFQLSMAHPWKPANYVIIDTDGGFDDMRTLCMFLASPNVRVLAITCSNGVVGARQGYIKTKGLLRDLYHEGILVGMDDNANAKSRNCKPALNFQWGRTDSISDPVPDAVSVVDYVLTNTQDPITFVSLGSLVTASDCSKHCALFKKRVKSILWTSDSIMDKNNFNYNASTGSYDYIVKESGIPLQVVYGNTRSQIYTASFIQKADTNENLYTAKAVSGLSQPSPYASNFFDEMACMYLHYPSLFSSDTSAISINHKLNRSTGADSIQAMVIKILEGNTVNQNQVLISFPLDSTAYFPDVMKKMNSTIRKYGKDEWVACVLGNELHRHLGVYAVIGTKMGIRAREYFGAGVDEFQVVSHAGEVPPYSCMNDGIQVSTGATLGHGLIHIAPDQQQLPAAEFTYLGQTIEISLKDEYRKKIEAEINDLSSIYGLNNTIYWEFVRIAALNYWANWDRHKIFTIRVLN
jgi:inosine-uridine nucleoside N-ribohydrolase